MNNRDNSIDILRSFALIGMIVSHCEPHWTILQLRGFDVPLIVFLSGVSYMLSAKQNGGNVKYLPYFWKRFKRLIFPTWVFLLIYYAVLYTGTSITGNLNVRWDEIMHNFTLTTGWYVWIIRVFLIIALVAPLLYKLSSNLTTRQFWLFFVCVLVIYEFIAKLSNNDAYYYLTMCIPYIMIFSYGAISERLSKRNLLLVSSVFLVVFVLKAAFYYVSTDTYLTTQIHKYPPQIYYTSYAIAITTFLWVFREFIVRTCELFKMSKILVFVGSHTLWIYFWHIIILMVVGTRISNSSMLFIVTLSTAVLLDYLQVQIVKSLSGIIENKDIKKNLSVIFLG